MMTMLQSTLRNSNTRLTPINLAASQNGDETSILNMLLIITVTAQKDICHRKIQRSS